MYPDPRGKLSHGINFTYLAFKNDFIGFNVLGVFRASYVYLGNPYAITFACKVPTINQSI